MKFSVSYVFTGRCLVKAFHNTTQDTNRDSDLLLSADDLIIWSGKLLSALVSTDILAFVSWTLVTLGDYLA
jgi:hypothetical protein